MEIQNYKPIGKGCLQARFDVAIEEWGLTIRDCTLFEKDGRRWIGMPSRKYQTKDGTTKNFDYLILEKERRIRFEKTCLEKIGKCQNNPVDSVPF